MRKKEYRRWDCDHETELNEEELTLEDHQFDYEHGRDTPTSTTFSQPGVALTGSHIQRKKGHRRTRIKEKVQVICVSTFILLFGFFSGFHVGVINGRNSSNSSVLLGKDQTGEELTSSLREPPEVSSLPSSSVETSEPFQPKPPHHVNVDNIRDILRRVSQKVHSAGTSEAKSMALAIRDLWRSYGLSVRVEQHKTLLTKTSEANYVEALDPKGSVLFRTSQDHLHPRPMIAFSPSADFNGTLIYGHYGRIQDFEYLKSSRILFNRSIALIRFGGPHPSKVAAIASAYGVKGLLFYPDPFDYPDMPSTAVRFSSLLTLGQIHEYQKHKSKFIIPAHTISSEDAEQLFRSVRQGNWMKRAPATWQGGLKTTYYLGPTFTASSKHPDFPSVRIRLRIFNEPKTSPIFNVVGSFSGWESDRYVIVGCNHDSWGTGAGEPGVGIALLSELARSFASAVQQGWKPRRSILFISWDGNLFASSGVSRWIQEHHFEISSRTISYIDLSGVLRGNQSLHVHSSPILSSVARKAISRVIHGDQESQFNPPDELRWRNESSIYFSSLLKDDDASFAFFGNLGVPFIQFSLRNQPQGHDYPLFHTSFDTFENFVNSVDPQMKGAETLGRIILETIVLLCDSSVLPIVVEDYVVSIQEAFGDFMAHYQTDLSAHNLSIAYLQAAVMRLEVIGDNFRTEMHNRSVINPEYDGLPPPPASTATKSKALLHRIINDKLMEIDRAFLLRSSDVYKHQVIGFSSDMEEIAINGSTVNNVSTTFDHYFPKLKEALECGRKEQESGGSQETRDVGLNNEGIIETRSYPRRRNRSREKRRRGQDSDAFPLEAGASSFLDDSVCLDWRSLAAQRIASLTRAFDAASAILQSPLLPEESE